MEFSLRPWSIDDLDSLVRYAGNYNIARYLTDRFPHPYTRENGIAFIEMATKEQPIHIFAIDIEGQASGGIGVHPMADVFRKNAELGYWLAEPFWGHGIMTKAVRQMIEFAFQTYDVTRLFARPFGTNIGSQKVLEKAGFILEARFEKTIFKNGEFEDELIYAVRSQQSELSS